MNTPTTQQRLSASAFGIVPSATLSTTALATAACAGPNIWTAWPAPLMVTLLNITVSGFAGTFGARTASNPLCPDVCSARRWAKAEPTGPSFDPIIRSMCATSLPSPTRDSPTIRPLFMGSPRVCVDEVDRRDRHAPPACHPPSARTDAGLPVDLALVPDIDRADEGDDLPDLVVGHLLAEHLGHRLVRNLALDEPVERLVAAA